MARLNDTQLTDMKDYLRENGLSTSMIATVMGIKKQTLSTYINGHADFGHSMARRFATATGLNVNWLLTGEGEMIATHQVINIDNSKAVASNNSTATNKSATPDEMLALIDRQMKMMEQQQEQINRLINYITKHGEL